ncbi:unnamed protein product [marine sediment metagenome]|uniref:Uncharacterized protein n=1 Tax=marine sediment metagenome TaxID=412755 RepID=X1VCG9_9ZZZZ
MGLDEAKREEEAYQGKPRRPEVTYMTSDQAVAADKQKRKPTAANKKYAKAFKKLAPTFKKKNGSWKKNGFKNCCKGAHKMCRK